MFVLLTDLGDLTMDRGLSSNDGGAQWVAPLADAFLGDGEMTDTSLVRTDAAPPAGDAVFTPDLPAFWHATNSMGIPMTPAADYPTSGRPLYGHRHGQG